MTARTASVTRSIDAPADQVWNLLADVHSWPRWGPFNDTETSADSAHADGPRSIRLGGRRNLQILVTTPDAPCWLRYRATSAAGRYSHTAEVTVWTTAGGGTELSWQGSLSGSLPDLSGRRLARLTASVTRLLARLASYAEDAPTTRVEWAAQRAATMSSAQASHELAA